MSAAFRLPAVMLAVGLGLVAAQPAHAQINPFRGSLANRLTNDDFVAMNNAVTSLLGRQALQSGETEVWNNPSTGTKGTIEVARDFKRGTWACHALRYTVYPGGADGQSTSRATLNWCKTAQGWKIV